MDYLALIAQLVGSQAGEAASQMDRDEAMKLIKSAVDEMGKINVPKLKELFLQKQADTNLAGIKDDPTYRSQQNAADAQLGSVIDSGGLTLADKAALNAIRNKTARTESAGRNAILSQMAARGTLDSGAQLAAQLDENSRSANDLNAAGEATAGRAEARAFEAIRERARNAGLGLDRDYRQKSDAARAQDAINAGNAAIANTAASYNSTLPQRDFDNQMRLAQGKAQPGYALAGWHAGEAKDTRDKFNKIGEIGAEAFRGSGSRGNTSSSGMGYDDKATTLAPDPGTSRDELTSEPQREPGVEYDAEGRPIRRGQNF